jgi:hypothetical protein
MPQVHPHVDPIDDTNDNDSEVESANDLRYKTKYFGVHFFIVGINAFSILVTAIVIW